MGELSDYKMKLSLTVLVGKSEVFIDGSSMSAGSRRCLTNSGSPGMVSSGITIKVALFGQIGVGKSALINMIMGIPDHSQAAARVGHGAHPVTLHNTRCSCVLAGDLRCELWDTRGLDTATDDHLTAMIPWSNSRSIFVWCVRASRIDFPSSWQQFCTMYEKYCIRRRQVIPVIVITQMTSSETGWELKCREQMRQLCLRV